MSNPTITRRTALLREIPLCAELSEKELAALSADFRLKEYGRDELIFRQGDESAEVYIVLRGKVRIYKISPGGEETTIAIFSTHDVIGEQAAIDALARSATAKAVSPVAALVMSRDRFLEHLHASAGLAVGLARLLSHKLRWTAAYAESIARFDAAGRLLHILLLYNERFGRPPDESGRYVVDLGLNQSDLASMVGARREWVNRLLADWRRRGLLEFDRGAIVILDLPRVIAERDSRLEANLSAADW